MSRKKKSKSKPNYLQNSFFQNFGGYRTNIITEEDLIKLKNNSPLKVGNRVTDFTDWIYDSIIPKRDNKKNLKEGTIVEKLLYKDLIFNLDKSDEYFKREYKGFLNDDWVLEYQDLSDDNKKTFKISRLKINEEPLFGRPDIVYKNRKNNDRIIIEVKSTRYDKNIPVGGWYNLQCQLWSYSHIDDFKDSNNIFLMGDIRIRKLTTVRKSVIYIGDEKLEILPEITSYPSGVTPKWRFKKEGKINTQHEKVNQFHEQCKMIFQMYGGEYIEL
jgi:hypothetical protein